MLNLKKIISIFLIILILSTLLISCGEKKKTPLIDNEAITTDVKDIECDYLLVYPSGTSNILIEKYVEFLSYLNENSKYKFQISPDSVNLSGKNIPKILLGSTKYAPSKQVVSTLESIRQNGVNDFCFKTYGNSLAIGWRSNIGCGLALDYFKKNLMMTVENFFNCDYSYAHFDEGTNYPTVLIGGASITDYKIVVPTISSHFINYAAEQLSLEIEKATGVRIPIVTDQTTESENEILIGNTNRLISSETSFYTSSKYIIFENKGSLVINGGDSYSTAAAAQKFLQMVRKAMRLSKTLSIKGGYFSLGNSESEETLIKDNYKLVYSEDFNTTSIDSENWSIYDGIALYGGEIIKDVFYRKDNVSISSDCLSLDCTSKDNNYGASLVSTKNKLYFKHGYVEVAARFPTQKGIWSRVFLTPVNENMSTVPEIGIFNSLNKDNTIFASATNLEKSRFDQNKYAAYDNGANGQSAYTLPTDSTFDSEFHIFAIDWTEDRISYYCDGIEYYRISIHNTSMANFNTEMYISAMIGCQLTGTAPDDADGLGGGLEIDYIRIYQKADSVNIKFNEKKTTVAPIILPTTDVTEQPTESTVSSETSSNATSSNVSSNTSVPTESITSVPVQSNTESTNEQTSGVITSSEASTPESNTEPSNPESSASTEESSTTDLSSVEAPTPPTE